MGNFAKNLNLGNRFRPPMNKSWLWPGEKTVKLAISTATILKEGVVGVENWYQKEPW